MKKLMIIIAILTFISMFAHADLKPLNCQFFYALTEFKGENMEEGSSFSLEVPPEGGFNQEDALVEMEDTQTKKTDFGKAPLFPVFYGNMNYKSFWERTAYITNIWNLSLYGHALTPRYPTYKDTLRVKMNDFEIKCPSYSSRGNLEFSSIQPQSILFFVTTSFAYRKEAAPVGILPFDLFLIKENRQNKIFICHMDIIFDYSFDGTSLSMTWYPKDVRYSNLNANYSVTFQPGKTQIVDPVITVRQLQNPENVSARFYNCDFYVMFPNVLKPFSDIDIRPVGKVLENKFHFTKKDISLCNVYASSKSNMFGDYLNTPDELLYAHRERKFPNFSPIVDIPIYDTSIATDTDKKNMEIIDGSILAPNEFSRAETMYSWDRCIGTHFPDNKGCNYRWIQLYAYENMPEIPPRLDYDIINKITGKTIGHIKLYFRMVGGWEGIRWWLDRVEGDYEGKNAQIIGGPGPLGISGNPWIISFS
ncbi:MAG: hypothetical protein ACP5OA_03020 [Candidatus Woesearchaeota archaeon]